uniref:Uncharacterized protein n=1 Tax=Anopheles albimanus TaxID=7167 RepID=A0A182FZK7_ANOAL
MVFRRQLGFRNLDLPAYPWRCQELGLLSLADIDDPTLMSRLPIY